MSKFVNHCVRFIFCSLLVTAFSNLMAGVEPYQNQLKGRIKKGDTLLVKDEKFRNPLFEWTDITKQTVSNSVIFQLTYDTVFALKKSFTCEIELEIEYFSRPDQVDPIKIDTVKLKINYSTESGAAYKSSDVYSFSNGHWVKIKVKSISSPELGKDLPPLLQLTNKIVIDRKYVFREEASVSPTGILSGPTPTENKDRGSMMQTMSLSGGTQTTNHLLLSWSAIPGAEEYDIEWTTVDAGSEHWAIVTDMLNNVPNANAAKLFRNNATRVTTHDNSYDISLVFSSEYIVVRFRQVTYLQSPGQRVEDTWDYMLSSNAYAIWNISGNWHEPGLNWEYSASFAEEGKKKEIVSYFDGTLRNRQSVTSNNTDEVSIIQENVYDEFGRPIADILPAPINEDNLHYFRDFNKNSAGSASYDFSHAVGTLGVNCEPVPQTLSTSSGASQYYSSGNTFLGLAAHNNYIPSAGGYPLSVKQYTPDNTGRIRLQGGVGSTFQPGVANSKVSKYYYGKPESWELDRLFGNDVGYAHHYLKNMVIDPNGQISISYLNASGKTIATALSGTPAQALAPLPSKPVVKDEVIPILRPGQFRFEATDMTLSATTTYLASITGTATLQYDVQKLIHSYAGTGFQICSNCYYDLAITIYNDCNTPIYTTTVPVGSTASDCNNGGLQSGNVSVNFPAIGEYYIAYKLSLSKKIVEQYTMEYIKERQTRGTLKTELDFILQYLTTVPDSEFEDCFSDCKTCQLALGTSADFVAAIKSKMADYEIDHTSNPANVTLIDDWASNLHIRLGYACQAIRANCQTDICSHSKELMLLDVSPGGQFALFQTLPFLVLEPAINVLATNFRNVFTVYPEGHSIYESRVIYLPDGTRTSPHAADFTLEHLVNFWKPEWAELFLQYHPEKCKLDFCNSSTAYFNWDATVKESINTASQINQIPGGASLSYNHLDPPWLMAADPFFTAPGSPGLPYAQSMQADLNSYNNRVFYYSASSSQTGGGVPMNKNIMQLVDYLLYCSTKETDQVGWGCGISADCRVIDQEWRLYRKLYFELKEKYYIKARNEGPCLNYCPVGTPVSNNNNCPRTADFIIEPIAAEDVPVGTPACGMKYMRVAYAGGPIPDPVTLTMYFPAEYQATPPVPATITFNTGDHQKIFCVNTNVEISSIKVKSLVCNPVEIVDCPFGNYGDLHINYSQVEPDVIGQIITKWNFKVIDQHNNTETLYWIVEKPKNDPPNTSGYCPSATAQFYNCYKVYVQGEEAFQYFNVWVVSCTQTSGQFMMAQTAQSSMAAVSCDEDMLTWSASNYYVSDCDPHTSEVEGVMYRFYRSFLNLCPSQSAVLNIFSLYNGTYYPVAGGRIEISSNESFTSFCLSTNILQTIMNYRGGKLYICVDYRGQCIPTPPPPPPPPICGQSMPSISVSAYFSANCNSNGYDYRFTRTFLGLCQAQAADLKFFRLLEGQYVPVSTGTHQIGLNDNLYSLCMTQNDRNLVANFSDDGRIYVCVTPLNSCPPPPPPPPVCPDVLLLKKSRFPEATYPTGPQLTDMGPRILADIVDNINKNCEAMADEWMLKLGNCLQSYSTQIRSTLRTRLIAVCQRGGDLNHPSGASTIPVGEVATAPNYASFEDAILGVLGISALSMDCNPWMMEAPYPHGVNRQAVTKTISTSDAAFCAKFGQFQTAATQAGQSLYQYLLNKYGAAAMNGMTANRLTLLTKSCTNCRFLLEEEMPLPVFMEPGTSGCIIKSEWDAALLALQAKIPSYSTSHLNYPEVLTNFMNHRFGFSLSYSFYEKYITDLVSNPSTVLCNKPPIEITEPDKYACLKSKVAETIINALRDYQVYITEEKKKFRLEYVKLCSGTAVNAKLTAKQQIYHYTLYYYDQAGNLIRTVPPEGVVFVSDADMPKVEDARINGSTTCSYTGPPTASTATAIKTNLSSALGASGDRAVEMWLYRATPGNMRTLTSYQDVSGNGHIMSACFSGNFLQLDIFQLQRPQPNTLSIVSSNVMTIDITPVLPLTKWTHIVVQGSDLDGSSSQVFVNGVFVPQVSTQPLNCPLVFDVNNPMPDELGELKHLRTYNRLLTAFEITANAQESCFGIARQFQGVLGSPAILASWDRFNMPVPGGETTIDGGTVEGQFPPIFPHHKLPTSYAYNSTQQVVKQFSPDGNFSRFWYDRLARLVASQNDEQLSPTDMQEPANRYSYTLYDGIGRVQEVGEKISSGFTMDPGFFTASQQPQSFYTSGTNRQITETVYDVAPSSGGLYPAHSLSMSNLRKRVSATFYRETQSVQATQGSYYSYDQMGNVQTLNQYIDGLGFKKIEYAYDLASGKVNFVAYQHGAPDRFYYRYKYDDDNRLIEVQTEISGNLKWPFGGELAGTTPKTDATYAYYMHGPLARMELGDDKVQGLDYAYTLQGWLKGVNGHKLNASIEIGRDGVPSTPRGTIARDVMAFALGYYQGDYQPVGTPANASGFPIQYTVSTSENTGRNLYNGNITHTTWALSKFNSGAPEAYAYYYDQLNRLKDSRYTQMNSSTTSWTNNTTAGNKFREVLTYDGNGNILSKNRWGPGEGVHSLSMDLLVYNYNTAVDNNGQTYLVNNRLRHVDDGVGAAQYSQGSQGLTDIDDQTADNYLYDRIGNLIKDNQETISDIDWTVYGKIGRITKANGNYTSYTYDPSGNRSSSEIRLSPTNITRNWYVRDAQGNILALYSDKNAGASGVWWKEQSLYGSSRLGIWKPNVNVSTTSGSTVWNSVGLKEYELTNHLGNVMATISDQKVPVSNYYEASVRTQTSYYAFGMQRPGRMYLASSSLTYRYGFNGKENDNEIKGNGNQQDYGMRIYDPRLGKFLSVDPLTKSFPMLTPYQFASNRPIDGIDLDGLEYISYHHYANGAVGKTEFYKMTDKDIKRIGGTTAGIHNSVSYGPDGKGVVHYFYDTKGERDNSMTHWQMRQTGGASDLKFHGLYSGPGSVTHDGIKGSEKYNFNEQPIDWADAIAKRHDMDYAMATATGGKYAGYLEDVRTLQADKDMVARIDQLRAAFINPLVPNEVEGVETPFRTSYSTEMDFTQTGQRGMINALATYKQWKVDNNLGNDNKYKDNREAFRKAHPLTAKILDQTQE